MAANRYGQIIHGDHHKINLRFASGQAREDFRNEFEQYHASHDHDGEVPRFADITAKDANSGYGAGTRQHGTIHPVKIVVLQDGEFVLDHNEQADYVTIDGYTFNEIRDYHNPSGLLEYSWYNPPTSCVPPIIVVENKFVDSNILQRHPLSAVFGDMPGGDYQSLIESVQKDGFIDNVVRVYEGQVLDGWHRYRAGKELNLLRKLKFQQWNEDKDRDGDPRVFVYARNMERRHLTPAQRGQIAVTFNKRFVRGGDRRSDDFSKGQSEPLKTTEELAKDANVSQSTIKRAVRVEKAGESESVISGEKTAHEVLKEKKAVELAEKRQLALDAEHRMWNALDKVAPDWDSDDFIAAACDYHSDWGVSEFPETEETGIPTIWEGRFDLLRREIELPADWIQQMLDKMAAPSQQSGEESESHTEILARLPDDIKAYLPTWINDNPGTEQANLKLLLGVRYEMKHGIPRGSSPFFREEMEDLLARMKANDIELAHKVKEQLGTAVATAEGANQIEKDYPKSLEEATTESSEDVDRSMNDRMDRLRSDLLNNHWLHHYSWEGLDILPFVKEYNIGAGPIDVMQKEIAAEYPRPEPETDSSVEVDKTSISVFSISDLFAEIKKRVEEETDYNPRVENDRNHNMKFNALSYLTQIEDPAAKLWIIADLGEHFCDENSN